MLRMLLFFLTLILIAFVAYRYLYRKNCTVEVNAVVLSLDERQSHARHKRITVYQPTFSYEWDGFQRILRPAYWSSTSRFQPGEHVALLINPDDPAEYKYKYISNDPCFRIGVITLSSILLILLLRMR